MVTQVLFYERAVPISKQKHGGWSVKTGTDYSFAKLANSVPLTATEFASAGREYAIVFAGGEDAVMPAVILGVRQDENLYVSDDGSWTAEYIPAFVRRYPFVFAGTDAGANFTLCIDEEFSGCNTDGRGERLFDADGERTQYLENILGFHQAYQAHFQRTQAFGKKLKDLDLLEPMQAQFTIGTGERLALSGFMAVNRDRLKALSGDQLSDLARADELELIFLHLQSMQNFTPMIERAAGTAASAAEENDEAATGEDK